jgi:hypothetical protein
MLRTETETDGDGTEETGYGGINASRKLAGSTMVSLGYHRDGADVEFEESKDTDLMSTSAVGVTVASAAFVLAGVALSTIPAILL